MHVGTQNIVHMQNSSIYCGNVFFFVCEMPILGVGINFAFSDCYGYLMHQGISNVVYRGWGSYRGYGSEWLTRTCTGVWHGEPWEFELRPSLRPESSELTDATGKTERWREDCVCPESTGGVGTDSGYSALPSGLQWKSRVCVWSRDRDLECGLCTGRWGRDSNMPLIYCCVGNLLRKWWQHIRTSASPFHDVYI